MGTRTIYLVVACDDDTLAAYNDRGLAKQYCREREGYPLFARIKERVVQSDQLEELDERIDAAYEEFLESEAAVPAVWEDDPEEAEE